MVEKDLCDSKEKIIDKKLEIVKNYIRQIECIAYELQYGSFAIEFKIRNGEIKEAHKISESVKLRPI